MSGVLCDTCLQEFDADRRRPKTLECGHAMCLDCLRHCWTSGSFSCPTDGQVFRFRENPEQLQDNVYLLSRVEHNTSRRSEEASAKAIAQPKSRFWCLDCAQEANAVCLGRHAVKGLEAFRAEEMKDSVVALESSVAVRHQVVDRLLSLDLAARVQHHVELSHGLADTEEGALRKAQSSVADDAAAWEQAKKSAREAAVRSKQGIPHSRQELHLLQVPSTHRRCALQCTLGEGESAEAWSATLEEVGDDDGELRAAMGYLMFLLKRAGKLRKNEIPLKTPHGLGGLERPSNTYVAGPASRGGPVGETNWRAERNNTRSGEPCRTPLEVDLPAASTLTALREQNHGVHSFPRHYERSDRGGPWRGRGRGRGGHHLRDYTRN